MCGECDSAFALFGQRHMFKNSNHDGDNNNNNNNNSTDYDDYDCYDDDDGDDNKSSRQTKMLPIPSTPAAMRAKDTGKYHTTGRFVDKRLVHVIVLVCTACCSCSYSSV